MMELEKYVSERIGNWLSESYDEQTKQEIRQLIESKDYKTLTDAFYKDLEFGTGGLRGIMGVGTNRVNKYTIGAATQGLSNYLLKMYPDEQVRVVIAHDNRNNAVPFAQIVADVFSANGIRVYFFDRLRPTPELSFAIRMLNCHSGVMLTASHNPKEYSGYKAYWKDGGQIIAPHDKNIIQEVNKITSISQVDFTSNSGLIERIGEEVDRKYIDSLKTLTLNPGVITEQHDLRIVFSPIHGAGVNLVPRALRAVGFTNVQLVEEQCTIDGNFPTVVYPNPEEAEAMAMSLDKARQINAELVMATDPDADRVGIAVKNRDGEYVLLNGNQTGVLLFHYILSALEREGRLAGNEYIVKTIVTTYLIDKIAQSKGVTCYNVLTGFKFIGALMTELEGKERFVAGAEESYGYLIGDFVRDKDAVVACNIIAEMTAYYKSIGKSLYEVLLAIYAEYGLYKEELISITKAGKEGAEEISRILMEFRKNPPQRLGGNQVVEVRDYLHSKAKHLTTGEETRIDLPSSNVLQFITKEGYIISARPSGTEPKIKFYISVNQELADVSTFSAAEAELNVKLKSIKEDLEVHLDS